MLSLNFFLFTYRGSRHCDGAHDVHCLEFVERILCAVALHAGTFREFFHGEAFPFIKDDGPEDPCLVLVSDERSKKILFHLAILSLREYMQNLKKPVDKSICLTAGLFV